MTNERTIYYQERGDAIRWSANTVPVRAMCVTYLSEWPSIHADLEAAGYRFVPVNFDDPDPDDRR